MAWLSMGASRRGASHARRGEAKQDAHRVLHLGDCENVLVAVAADGAGSATRGGAGAALAVRILTEEARRSVGAHGFSAVGVEEIREWIRAARARLAEAADAHGLVARDLATTVLLALSDGAALYLAHVGDGAILARCGDDGGWRILSWPEHGLYAGATFFVTDDPEPLIRVVRVHEPVTAIALLTDGLERLVLDFAARTPHVPFFERMSHPLDARAAARAAGGRDIELEAALRRHLDRDEVRERTDDDVTLVVAVRLPISGGGAAETP